MKIKHLIHFGFVSALFAAPRVALAQDDAAGHRIMAEPEPAPPPAATAPAASTTATAPAAPATAPTAEPATEAVPNEGGDREPAAAINPEARSEADAEGSSLVFTSAGGSLQLKGRIFVLAELSHRSKTVVSTSGGLTTRDVNALDLSLASARFAVAYRSPLRWLWAELELEIAGRPVVKDAYILAGKRFFAKAGQFKVPSAALELESPWTLPLVRRGLVHDLLTDWLDVAGRRPGLALGYRGKGALKPRLTLGAFQGTTMTTVRPGDRDVELIDRVSMEAQTLAARAEVRLVAVDIGAWYEHRVGSQVIGEFSHFPTFGLDATVDRTFESGGLRLWVDGSAGKSLYVNDDKPGADEAPLFVLGRALVGYRFGGVALGAPYVEPFGFFALLDPDAEVVADFATEAALGVNAGYWDRVRLTLQGEMTDSQRNFPKGFLDSQDPERLSLLLQAGARF